MNTKANKIVSLIKREMHLIETISSLKALKGDFEYIFNQPTQLVSKQHEKHFSISKRWFPPKDQNSLTITFILTCFVNFILNAL